MIFTVLAAVLAFAIPHPGWATFGDVICDDRDRLQQQLQADFGSEKRGSGMRGPDALVEIWVDAAGDWTMVQNYANGTACIVAIGEHWEMFAAPSDPA
ncbi:hypothetical protein [Loktanella agnita]|uniref:hypothetical protein n=1 Tax=Loktanella agnita TaxID=287097 RepID=UPI003985B948